MYFICYIFSLSLSLSLSLSFLQAQLIAFIWIHDLFIYLFILFFIFNYIYTGSCKTIAQLVVVPSFIWVHEQIFLDIVHAAEAVKSMSKTKK